MFVIILQKYAKTFFQFKNIKNAPYNDLIWKSEIWNSLNLFLVYFVLVVLPN